MRRAALALLLAVTTAAAPPAMNDTSRAVASFALPDAPFFPGSVIPLDLNGASGSADFELLGPGRISNARYLVPDDATGSATLVSGAASGIAMRTIDFATPPNATQPFLAVASYEDGIVIHDVSAPFLRRGILALGGAPGDVAIDPGGSIGAAATDGTSGIVAAIDPWHVSVFDNVPFADEAAFDPVTRALFITNRDTNGSGALTRIAADGTVRSRMLGLTAEGLALDAKRRRAYVANVNDGTISIVDMDSLVELQRFPAVARVFSLALNASGTRLYAVSNQSYTSPFGAAGSAIAIDVSGGKPRIVARSAPLAFPVGVAIDERHHHVFVTDERDDDVYVLDPANMRQTHAALPTCRTPWKPAVDEGRLYLPCARADEIDVVDTATLRRVPMAPFRTGEYPLAVAVWHPKAGVKR